jgi:hypothetical protein
MSDYEKELEAFLIKIGQIPASKPAPTKKDEE